MVLQNKLELSDLDGHILDFFFFLSFPFFPSTSRHSNTRVHLPFPPAAMPPQPLPTTIQDLFSPLPTVTAPQTLESLANTWLPKDLSYDGTGGELGALEKHAQEEENATFEDEGAFYYNSESPSTRRHLRTSTDSSLLKTSRPTPLTRSRPLPRVPVTRARTPRRRPLTRLPRAPSSQPLSPPLPPKHLSTSSTRPLSPRTAPPPPLATRSTPPSDPLPGARRGTPSPSLSLPRLARSRLFTERRRGGGTKGLGPGLRAGRGRGSGRR